MGVRWHGAAPFAAAGAGTTAVAALSLTRGALVPAIARRTAAVVAAGGAVVTARGRGGVDVARLVSTTVENGAPGARAFHAAARTQQALALNACTQC